MTKVIGHRGAPNCALENTIESFKKAVELGVDMIELDVRMTKDKKLIIFHNHKIGGQKIESLTFKQIRKINSEVTSLEKALEFLKGQVGLDVELKEVGYELMTVRMMLKYFSPSDFVISSFNSKSIKIVKKHFPRILTGLLVGLRHPRVILRGQLSLVFPLTRYKMTKADFVIIHKMFLFSTFLWRAKLYKVPVIVWSINNKKIFQKLVDKNIYGVITDSPELSREIEY